MTRTIRLPFAFSDTFLATDTLETFQRDSIRKKRRELFHLLKRSRNDGWNLQGRPYLKSWQAEYDEDVFEWAATLERDVA